MGHDGEGTDRLHVVRVDVDVARPAIAASIISFSEIGFRLDNEPAIETIHHPASAADLGPDTLARQRLAYDEVLASQVEALEAAAEGTGGPRSEIPPHY